MRRFRPGGPNANSIDANSIDDNSPCVSSPPRTAFAVLAGLSFCHLLNDLLQSLLPAIYPMLKSAFGLDFWQIGLITFVNAMTASLLQPVIGLYTDRRPQPFSLAIGMSVTLAGLLLLAYASRFSLLLLAAALVGVGSAVFHPESSRIARLASGGRHGFAQSLFQTGGNFGTSLGPLLAAFIVLPRGRGSIAWFSGLALVAIAILWRIGQWYGAPERAHHPEGEARRSRPGSIPTATRRALLVLLALVFSKYVYLTSLTSYYTFFLIHRFHVSVQSSQIYLFLFLGAVAAGTFIGGPVGDRFGRKYVIWGSIFGVLPFTLALPYVVALLDGDPERGHRPGARVGVFRDSRLRAGARAGPRRPHRGVLLRLRLRHRRPRRRRPRQARRSHEHRSRLSRVRVPAGDWRAGDLATRQTQLVSQDLTKDEDVKRVDRKTLV